MRGGSGVGAPVVALTIYYSCREIHAWSKLDITGDCPRVSVCEVINCRLFLARAAGRPLIAAKGLLPQKPATRADRKFVARAVLLLGRGGGWTDFTGADGCPSLRRIKPTVAGTTVTAFCTPKSSAAHQPSICKQAA